MCTLTCLYPGLIFTLLISSGVTPSSFSNSIRTFLIYFSIALVQNSVPDCLSISYAYFTVLVTRIKNLCDVRQYLYFTLEIILYLCRKVSLIHQLKSGSSLILFSTKYSVSSTGVDCLRSFSGNQSAEPSFHYTKIFHP